MNQILCMRPHHLVALAHLCRVCGNRLGKNVKHVPKEKLESKLTTLQPGYCVPEFCCGSCDSKIEKTNERIQPKFWVARPGHGCAPCAQFEVTEQMSTAETKVPPTKTIADLWKLKSADEFDAETERLLGHLLKLKFAKDEHPKIYTGGKVIIFLIPFLEITCHWHKISRTGCGHFPLGFQFMSGAI